MSLRSSLLAGALCGAAILLCSCSSVVTGQPRGTDLLVRVPFATLRNADDEDSVSRRFGDKRGDLTAGYCTVLLDGSNDGGRAHLRSVDTAALPDVLELGEAAQATGVVVYIHGYGENFDKSCRRAALMQDRLGLDNRLLLFSWPANRNLLTYTGDIADLEWSLEYFYGLLGQLADIHGPERVHIIAHSLGARGMVEIIKQIEVRNVGRRLGELILIAPDIARDGFAEDVGVLRERVTGLTIFVSSKDRVLKLSQAVNIERRVGQGGRLAFPDAGGVAVIDVAPVGRMNVSGHVYHIYHPAVIEELRRMLGTADTGPAHFARQPTDIPGYFELVPVDEAGSNSWE